MSDLSSLYALHKLDSAMYGLKKEAESLDLGQAEKAEQKRLTNESAEVIATASAISKETKDREIQQKGFADKIASFDKKLYDGSVVSPKEIENIEKEIKMLKGLSEKNDERLMELYEAAPAAIEGAKGVNAKLGTLQKRIEDKRARAVARHAEIKIEFEALRSRRPDVALTVEKDLRERYEEVRKRTGDTAMAEVTETLGCSRCGMHVPEKQIKQLDADRLVFCEGCHRILIKVVTAG